MRTTRQAVAAASPCYVAEETVDRRFGWRAWIDGRLLSFVLTVNVGLE